MIFLYYSYLVRNISVTTVASFAETRCCRLALYCGKNTVDWIRCLKEVDCTVVAGRQQWCSSHIPPKTTTVVYEVRSRMVLPTEPAFISGDTNDSKYIITAL